MQPRIIYRMESSESRRMNTITLSKFYPMNFIGDVWEPHYNGGRPEVYIDKQSIRRSKLDIKLKFAKVNDTSEFAGYWYITKRNAVTKKTFLNNGLPCYVVPWESFRKLTISEREYV